MSQPDPRRGLLWIVATAFFMEQLDSTIVNTAVPAFAASLQVAPLELKGVVASCLLSLAVFIPVSGWVADRFGRWRVFGAAVAPFTLASGFARCRSTYRCWWRRTSCRVWAPRWWCRLGVHWWFAASPGHHVAEHLSELDVHPHQRLLHALHPAGLLGHQHVALRRHRTHHENLRARART